MLNNQLIAAMGLLKLQPKGKSEINLVKPTVAAEKNQNADVLPAAQPPNPNVKPDLKTVKLDKSEFRLLVKMLHAIGHECQYEMIQYDAQTVSYQHPKKTLVFKDISLPDTKHITNLSSLSDILANNELKRPVWEKLKAL